MEIGYLIWGILFVSGIGYAYIVADIWKSPRMSHTIAKVIVGVAMTNTGISSLVWFHPVLSEYTIVILVILWGSYIVTSLPMALFMYSKYKDMERMATVLHQHDEQAIKGIFSGRR